MTSIFRTGDRVQYSALAFEKNIRTFWRGQRSGIVKYVRAKYKYVEGKWEYAGEEYVYVLWDGIKTPQKYHPSFLELEEVRS